MSDPAPLRRVLVTGATGFVGSRVVARFATDGWEVHAVCRPLSDRSRAPAVAGWHVYEGGAEELVVAVQLSRPEVVVHIAATIVADHTPSQIVDLVTGNITFGTQLADAMTTAGCQRLVNTGTFWQHYNGDDRYSPVNLYAATTEASEAVLR